MKRIVISAMLLAVLVLGGCSGVESRNDLLYTYESDPTVFRGIQAEAFSDEEQSAPSDEELARMLDFAMASGSSHMVSPAHFIVIRDYDEQIAILNGFGNPTATPGTVTVLVLADTLKDQEYHQEEYNEWYKQSYYGIFDAGSATGYLSIAANTMGYKTHAYAALNIPIDGEINVANIGSEHAIREDGWDIEKYLTSKDGTVNFKHTIGAYTQESGAKEIDAAGNLSLLCAVVIGKTDPEIDAVSSATQSVKSQNYSFWDPQN